jgi:hypothetical protein
VALSNMSARLSLLSSRGMSCGIDDGFEDGYGYGYGYVFMMITIFTLPLMLTFFNVLLFYVCSSL